MDTSTATMISYNTQSWCPLPLQMEAYAVPTQTHSFKNAFFKLQIEDRKNALHEAHGKASRRKVDLHHCRRYYEWALRSNDPDCIHAAEMALEWQVQAYQQALEKFYVAIENKDAYVKALEEEIQKMQLDNVLV